MNQPVELNESPRKNNDFFKSIYRDIFSDNRNVTILILVLLLLLTFSGIQFVQNIAMFLLHMFLFIYRLLSDVLYTLIYSTGEVLNATSNTVANVSKVSLDLGNGAINDVGNLMTDVQCQYKGNPVQPNQCRGGVDTANKKVKTAGATPAVVKTHASPTPRITGKIRPKTTATVPVKKARVAPVAPKVVITRKPAMTTTTGVIPTVGVVSPPVNIVSPSVMASPSATPSSNPFYTVSDTDAVDVLQTNFSTDQYAVRKFNLDNVLEGFENRTAAEFEPDPMNVANKPAWCYVGSYDDKKTCIQINSMNQSCMSGLLFEDETSCTK